MDMIAIGKIRTSHGVKGYLKVVTYSGETEHFFGLDELELRKGVKNIKFKIEDVKPNGPSVILKLEGIDSPEVGKSYGGFEIWVPRSEAAPLEEGEFYHADLVSCFVYHEEEKLGKVLSITEGGGGELIELELSSGERVFIPFRGEFIGEINIEDKRIELLNRWVLG